MDWDTLFKLPRWRQCLYRCFRTLSPPKYAFPYFICEYSPQAMQAIRECTEQSPAVWQEWLYEHDTKKGAWRYIEYSPHVFHQWSNERNQREIGEYVRQGKSTDRITLIIPSGTPVAVLEDFDLACDSRGLNVSDAHEIRDVAFDFLERFGWLCLTLDIETNEFMLCAFSTAKSSIFHCVQNNLDDKGIQHFTVNDVLRNEAFPP